MIELLSVGWNLSIRAALLKYAAKNSSLPAEVTLPATVERYSREHIESRQRFATFWEEAKQRLLHRPGREIVTLLRQLNLYCEISQERWSAGPGKLLGSASRKSVELLFHPGIAKQDHNRISSHRTVFTGRNWQNVLIIPYYQLPGKLSGFVFLGSGAILGDSTKGIVYKAIPPVYLAPTKTINLGLGLLTTVQDAESKWGKIVFALEDPILALQLQMKQFFQNQRPLPLVTWSDRDDYPPSTWHCLQNKKLVFWPRKFTSRVVGQAKHNNAWISTAGPAQDSDRSLESYVIDTFNKGLLRRIVAKAKRWQKAMASRLGGVSNTEAEELLLKLQLTASELNAVLQECDEETITRVQRLVREDIAEKVTVLNRREVYETEQGWYLNSNSKSKPRELLCNAILRIDQVLYNQQTESAYYRGRVLFKGKQIPFCDTQTAVESNTGKWLQQLLLSKKLGLLKYLKSWSPHLVRIAQEFQEPELVESNTTVGWDPENSCFVMPGLTLYDGGRTEETDRSLFRAGGPGWSADHSEFTAEDAAWLSKIEITFAAPFWAGIASILGNLFSRICGETRSGIVLVGDSQTVYRGLSHAGCPQAIRAAGLGNAALERKITEVTAEHDWPAPIGGSYEDFSSLRKWVHKAYEQPSIMLFAKRRIGYAMACNGSWNVIDCEAQSEPDGSDNQAAYKLISSYLRHVCSRGVLQWKKSLQEHETPAFQLRILKDLEAFLRRHYKQAKLPWGLIEACYYPDHPKLNAEAFGLLLASYSMAKKPLQLIEQGDTWGNYKIKPLIVDHKSGLLEVPIRSVTRYMRYAQTQTTPQIDMQAVSPRLAFAGLLADRICAGTDDEVWHLDLGWFLACERKVKTQTQQSFKIVG